MLVYLLLVFSSKSILKAVYIVPAIEISAIDKFFPDMNGFEFKATLITSNYLLNSLKANSYFSIFFSTLPTCYLYNSAKMGKKS